MIAELVLLGLTVCPVPKIPEDQSKGLVAAGWDTITRTYYRTYDLDNNLKPDYHIEYEIKGIKEDKTFLMSPFPVVYFWDSDGDGVYDKIYIDTQGNGRCEDLRPYTGKEKG